MLLFTLDSLPLNYCGIVKNTPCAPNTKRRLLDLGLVKDTKITPILNNPMGDPVAYEIRGSTIALRKEDSKLIDVTINL